MAAIRFYVGITDSDWYETLAALPGLDEVNFWQPSGSTHFRALSPGELFLFKLHSPRQVIVGGGLFAHMTLLPVSLAWSFFELKNGAHSLGQMRGRIEKYRRRPVDRTEDYQIGCILLEQPFFLRQDDWIPAPRDWAQNIVRGRGYDTSEEQGLRLWRAVENRLRAAQVAESIAKPADAPRFGEPVLVRPRLGQGSFRALVTDAYHRRCAVTGERTLPALQAGHIKPYADGGVHEVRNGLLLRSDLHQLFDQGYITVVPEMRLEVSRRIREEFENGRDYYELQGRPVTPPGRPFERPAPELLRWHNDTIFRG